MGGGTQGEKPYEKIDVPVEQPKDPHARTLGLDVARYQDKMDASEWKLAYKKGYRFVFAKATDGITGKDAYHQLHRRLSKQAGFLFGSYHFFRFAHDPIGQAEHFFKTSGGSQGELPPVLDIEWDKYSPNGKYGEGKRMDQDAADMALRCLREIERLFKVTPILYTNYYFFPEKVKNPNEWERYVVWIPSYSDALKPGGEKVKIPFPWKSWTFWQDSEDLKLGDVTAIDTNVFRGSVDDLKRLIK